ncbi:hypothetical protein ABIA33_001383 [Streptacidiphilus sp. MAP12-16]|uniref:replication-relaxation family protein n=1 Tax=Streptacidiphilus sp. MAP12-16 TaxID=3156300 RepID=UPI003517E39E
MPHRPASPAVTIRRGPTRTAASGGRRRTPLSALASRLTARDLWLLDMLAEHTALTSHQITDLAFTGHRTANRRLALLHQLGLLDSFRLRLPVGSAPETYVLGQTGAQLLAVRHATTPAAVGWTTEHASRTAYNPNLAHDLGASTFFTQLAHTRAEPDPTCGRLAAWWSEARCARSWGDLVRPDGQGRLTTGHRFVSFFLEYDTGTEALPRLAAKLDDYAQAAVMTGQRPLVLFTLHSHRREANFHQRLAGHPALPRVAVATCARDLPATASDIHRPCEAVWLPVGQPAVRSRLIDLPDAWHADWRPAAADSLVPDTSPLPAPRPVPPVQDPLTGLLRRG